MATMADGDIQHSKDSENEYVDCESDSSVYSQSDPRSKRKASPLETPQLKRFTHATRKNLQKTGQKGSTPKVPIKVNPPLSFADAMLATFNEPNFVMKAAPHMAYMMQSTINAAIEKAVKTAVDETRKATDPTVKTIIESNKTLQETVKKQNDLIEKQQSIIESQTTQIHTHTTRITEMENEIQELSKETDALRLELNNVEQYGCRNSVRFSNMKIQQKDFATETEMKRYVTEFINKSILTSGDSITEKDIDRCHEAGSKTKKQILVKFHKYDVKNKVFTAKSKLKNNPDRIFLTEDLTRFNQEIVKTLIKLRKDHKITSFWTRNGSIFIKIAEPDSPIKIRRLQDLTPLGLN